MALVVFKNATGDDGNSHWKSTLDRLVTDQLKQVHAIRLVPGITYGLQQVGHTNGSRLAPSQAEKLGALLGAGKVLWGEYHRQGEKWLIKAYTLDVGAGGTPKESSVASADWFEVRDQITESLLTELGIKPSDSERQKMRRRWTSSAAVLEDLSKAQDLDGEVDSVARQEGYLHRAIEADPLCAEAHSMLAGVFATSGRKVEAEKEARQAEKMRPDNAWAHLILGFCLQSQNNPTETEKEFQIAARLEPEEPEIFVRLGEFYHEQHSLDRAIRNYEKALRLDPFSASGHAHLGYLYAVQRKREQAIAHLREAERLPQDDEVNTEQFLSQSFESLHENPSAAEHYQKFIVLAKAQSIDPVEIKTAEESLRKLKSTLTLAFVTASQPRAYTDQSLREALREKLTPKEQALAINPLSTTAEMSHWVRTLTDGATNDLQKARMLFDSLSRHLDPGPGGTRTAREVFADWNKPGSSFLCLEYAHLYVALARSVGLQAFVVDVAEDYEGRQVRHACASVFISGQALLVDPAYGWFGVPHKSFKVVDDFQAVIDYLIQFDDVERNRIACKLDPGSARAQFALASALVREELWKEAGERLPAIARLDTNGWMTMVVQAEFAAHEEHWDDAIVLLRKAVERNPDNGDTHVRLGLALVVQQKFRAAREAFEAGLRSQPGERNADIARQGIAKIDRAVGHYDEAIESNPDDPLAYFNRGESYAREGDFGKAIKDFSEAIRLNPRDARALAFRGYAFAMEGELDKAIKDYDDAIRVNPKESTTFHNRGHAYEKKGQFARALDDFTEALRLNPKDYQAYGEIGSIRACSADASFRNGTEAVEAATKACKMSGWKDCSAIDTLAAAYAEDGNFALARKYQKQALGMAPNAEKRSEMQKRLALYEQGLPFHQTATH